MLTPEMIANKFGSAWCENALFYSYPKSLRFELGIGDHPIDRFFSAHYRALTVLQDAFRDVPDLHIAIQICVDSKKPGVKYLLECFRSLQECGLPLPLREAIETSQPSYDDERWQCIMIMPIQLTDISRALWPAMAHDLLIEPRLEADIYLLSPEIGILANPYDDRGMDLIGPNTARLKEIFDTYNSWLLSYDLDAMNKSYGSPDVINRSDQE